MVLALTVDEAHGFGESIFLREKLFMVPPYPITDLVFHLPFSPLFWKRAPPLQVIRSSFWCILNNRKFHRVCFCSLSHPIWATLNLHSFGCTAMLRARDEFDAIGRFPLQILMHGSMFLFGVVLLVFFLLLRFLLFCDMGLPFFLLGRVGTYPPPMKLAPSAVPVKLPPPQPVLVKLAGANFTGRGW